VTDPVEADAVQQHYQRLQAQVGMSRSVELGRVQQRDFGRFAAAAGIEPPGPDGDPTVAPELFLSSVMGWGAGGTETDLAVDGTSANDSRGFPLDGLRLMGAGQDLEFHAPVRDGMDVTETTQLSEVQLKLGSSGHFLTLQLVRRFLDQDGSPLVTCRETFIGR
jgi:hypothetical protein